MEASASGVVLCVLAIVLPRHFLDLDIFDRLKIEALQLGTALDNNSPIYLDLDPGHLGTEALVRFHVTHLIHPEPQSHSSR